MVGARLSGQAGTDGSVGPLVDRFSWSVDEGDGASAVLTPHLLQTLYEASLGADERRTGGIVYTPERVAGKILDAAFAALDSPQGPLTVADPAAGSGAFLVPLARRRPDARIVGIDPAEDALAIAERRLALLRRAAPQTAVPELVGTAQAALACRGPFDMVIGNPPYVRHEARQAPDGNAIRTLAERLGLARGDERVASLLSGRADLYATFFLLALAAVRPGGVVAFVTGDSWLDARFGAALQSLFVELCDEVRVLPEGTRSFVQAGVNTVVTVARRRRSPGPSRVRMGDAPVLLSPTPGHWGARFLRASSVASRLAAHEGMAPLGELAALTYGTKPGIRDFFVVPPGTEGAPDDHFLLPVLVSAREVEEYVLAPQRLGHRLFACPRSLSELDAEGFRRTAAYVRGGAARKTHARARHTVGGVEWPNARSVQGNRPEWHCLTPRPGGSFVVPCLLGTRVFFAGNPSGVIATNSFYQVALGPGIDEATGLGVLNSSVSCLMMETWGRPKGFGGLNLYGPELRALPVPDPRRMDPAARGAIADAMAFMSRRRVLPLEAELGHGERSRMPADRRALDEAVFGALGILDSEREVLYSELLAIHRRRLRKGRSIG